MSKTLIVRYSQIGDALIAIPVINSLAKNYPNDEFTVLTNPIFAGIFSHMPKNVKLFPMIYRKKKHFLRGLIYLFDRYSLLLKIFFSEKYDHVALFQNGTFDDQLQFLLSKKKSQVVKIDLKEFRSKEKLKVTGFLETPSLSELYIKVLSQLGYSHVKNEYDASCYKDEVIQLELLKKVQVNTGLKRIGIAPFSRLKPKIYPLEKMEEIIRYFSTRQDVQVLIFGGGDSEKAMAETWSENYENVISLIGKLSFEEELYVISSCEFILTMDSANLHIASIVNTPAISIWGPSHPRLGYYPYNQLTENVVQQEIYCRPCSFFGENPCTNPDLFACMNILPETIIDKMNAAL